MTNAEAKTYAEWSAAHAEVREWTRRDWRLTADEREQRDRAEQRERIARLRLESIEAQK